MHQLNRWKELLHQVMLHLFQWKHGFLPN